MENGMAEEIEGLLNSGLTPAQLEFYGLEYRYVTQYADFLRDKAGIKEIVPIDLDQIYRHFEMPVCKRRNLR